MFKVWSAGTRQGPFGGARAIFRLFKKPCLAELEALRAAVLAASLSITCLQAATLSR